VDTLGDVCDQLLRDSNALAVLLVDDQWNELARAGAATLFDESALSRLRATPAEREQFADFDKAAGRHYHLSVVGARILVVLFDDTSSLGLIRLRAKKARETLLRVH
jgi:hypothetical protein